VNEEDKVILASELVSEASGYLNKGVTPIEVIKQLRVDHGIDLVTAKGVYIFAKEGISLHEYQDRLLKDLEPILNQMEDEEWEIDRVKMELSTNLNDSK